MRFLRLNLFRLLALLAALSLVAAACGDSGSSDNGTAESGNDETIVEDEGDPKHGGDFVAPLVSDGDTLDPHLSSSYNVHYRVGLASSRLLKPDLSPEYKFGEAPLTGDLAESWEISDDFLTYTFNLRDNVFWHDIAPVNGRQFVADDVIATFERVNEVGFQRYMLEKVTSIEAPDDLTIVITLSEPFAPLLNYMGHHQMWIMPREGVEGDYDVSKMTIGTGPFVMTEWDPNVTTSYERNDKYFEEGIPYVDSVELPVVPDQGARTAAFRAGEVDTIGSLNPREIDSILSSVPGSSLRSEIGWAPLRIFVDMEKEPFTDIRVRKAMSMAVDRTGLGTAIYDSGQLIGPVNAHVARYVLPQDELEELMPYDVEEAKSLLADAGYPDGFTTKLMVTTGYGPNVVSAAEWVAEDLEAIGITVEIDVVDYATYFSIRWPERQYEAAVGLSTPFTEADEWLRAQFHTDGSRNWYGISDPELDSMLDEQSSMMDEDERIDYVKDIQRYILTEVVNPIDLWVSDTRIVLSEAVKGYHSQPQYGLNHYAYLWLDE